MRIDTRMLYSKFPLERLSGECLYICTYINTFITERDSTPETCLLRDFPDASWCYGQASNCGAKSVCAVSERVCFGVWVCGSKDVCVRFCVKLACACVRESRWVGRSILFVLYTYTHTISLSLSHAHTHILYFRDAELTHAWCCTAHAHTHMHTHSLSSTHTLSGFQIRTTYTRLMLYSTHTHTQTHTRTPSLSPTHSLSPSQRRTTHPRLILRQAPVHFKFTLLAPPPRKIPCFLEFSTIRCFQTCCNISQTPGVLSNSCLGCIISRISSSCVRNSGGASPPPP